MNCKPNIDSGTNPTMTLKRTLSLFAEWISSKTTTKNTPNTEAVKMNTRIDPTEPAIAPPLFPLMVGPKDQASDRPPAPEALLSADPVPVLVGLT